MNTINEAAERSLEQRRKDMEVEALEHNAGRKPKFGDEMRNPWASLGNPQRDGYFVRSIKQWDTARKASADSAADARGAARYEYVRRMHPTEFAMLYSRNLAGEGAFDDLLDASIAAIQAKG